MPFYHGLKTYENDLNYPNKQDWIARRLLTLRKDLWNTIGKKRKPNSLIVGSWNIRAFDEGVPRLDESFHYIAEIISNFDICAVQEVKKDLGPLEKLRKLLGPNWDYFVSDASTHKGGNRERMAFLYNTDKVFFRRLIGELVADAEDLQHSDQIARSPFFAAFQAGWFRFCLVSTHIIFGGSSKREKQLRADEVSVITKMLLKRARDEDQVYIFLGDMNIDSDDGPIMKALRDSGMHVPLFPPANMAGDRFYDQMAFTEEGHVERKTKLLRHGLFDWRKAVFGPWPDPAFPENPGRGKTKRVPDDVLLEHYFPICNLQRVEAGKDEFDRHRFADEYVGWTTFEMSDHLPIWVELEIDYSDEYIARYVK